MWHGWIWVPAMTLKIKRLCEKHGTRICLAGELRCTHLVDVRTEIEQAGQPATLDLDEVEVVDLDGVRLLNECQARGIQVVNCPPYIREWMLHEKRTHAVEE
jgi:ABC-type transporter Mla MlaB component